MREFQRNVLGLRMWLKTVEDGSGIGKSGEGEGEGEGDGDEKGDEKVVLLDAFTDDVGVKLLEVERG